MKTFCTICTSAYFPVVKALFGSLQHWEPGAGLQVLIVDNNTHHSEGSLQVLQPEDLSNTLLFLEIKNKYAAAHPDHFRWALKPLLIGYLLEKGYTKVIYADPDLYFVGAFDFLFDLLNTNAVLLTPHWADLDITGNPDSVLSVMKGGIFNAGFFGAAPSGLPAVECWAELCHYKIEKKPGLGLYDDQKYLDLLPAQFDGIHMLKHRGCNLAAWNIQSCRRELINGRLLINKSFEPVFIHFTRDTIINILNRNDALLKPYLDDYMQELQNNGYDLMKNLEGHLPAGHDSVLYRAKHGLRLRTRMKRFLYRIAEKL